ncbi:YpiB family protein [Fictibacillus nanhaiensis]|uniref:YpiB family protein n=1 Tax=Fictibacillus nanhaiensis TaxID=742169 RepID=UPI002E21BFE0|nr:YpiB family protein [Fictibacillus nanhaiensis]
MHVITTEMKKEFVKWLLNTYQLAQKEHTWLLNYLSSTNEQLEKVHFVDVFEDTHKKRIILHTNCSHKPGHFEFNLNGNILGEPEKTFHNIRRNPEEHVFVKLIYRDKAQSMEWGDICEAYSTPKFTGFEVAAQLILDQSFETFNIMQLQKEIDNALETGDKALFMKLTDQLLHTENKLVKSF